jgi:ankyrin repeat protein
MSADVTSPLNEIPKSRGVALAFAIVGCVAAAKCYLSRAEMTEPGGELGKGLWGVLWLVVGGAALTGAAVASAWTLNRSESIRRVAVDIAIPALATLALAVAMTVPVGFTLMRAVHRENIGAVRRALLFGVSPNTHSTWGWYNVQGDSALQVAAKRGNVRIVQLLLDHGATIEQADLTGAARAGHLDVVTLLVDRGAAIDGQDENEFTAFSNAASFGQFEVADYLASRGANFNAGRFYYYVVVEFPERLAYFANRGLPLDEPDNHFDLTPLMIASERGLVESVQFLLDHGCDPKFRNRHGATALSVLEAKVISLNKERQNAITQRGELNAARWRLPNDGKWEPASYRRVRAILQSAEAAD